MLRIDPKQRSFFDAGYLVSDQRDYEFARFYEREILPLVQDRDFEELFSSRGRSATSPALLLHVSVLATVEGLSDRKAAKAVRTRLDWKVALGLRVDAPGFDSTRLVRFRSRFLGKTSENEQEAASSKEKDRARLLFDRILDKLCAYGLVKKDQAVRLDSTHIQSAAKNINRYQTVFESLRLAVRALDSEDRRILDAEEFAPLREKYSKSPGAFDLKRDRVRKNLDSAVKDALRLLGVLKDGALSGLQAVQTLQRAVHDNVVIQRKGNQRKRGRPKKEEEEGVKDSPEADLWSLFQSGDLNAEEVEVVERQGGDRMISPHDESARLGVKKGGKLRWVGSKLHATETVPEKRGDPSFLVDFDMTPANEPDVVETLRSQERLQQRGFEPARLYVDAGYVSGKTVAHSREDYGTELMGPPPTPRASGRFQPSDFSVDFEAARATCPAGKTQDSFRPRYEAETLLGTDVSFFKATCLDCPLAAKCLGKGQTGRKVFFTAHHQDLVEQREKARTPEFRRDYKKRSPGEGIFAELAGPLGMRRSTVKGPLKIYFEHTLGMIAINVKRLGKAFSGGFRPALT